MKRLFWLLLMWGSLTATEAHTRADATRLQVMLETTQGNSRLEL